MNKASRVKKLIVVLGLMVFAYLLGYSWGYDDAADSEAQSNTVAIQNEAAKAQEYTPPTPEEILKLVNEERSKVGVAPLEVFEPAMQSAQFKAEDMVKRDYFAHTSPGSDRNNGLDYFYSLDNQTCRFVGENIRRNGDVKTSLAAIEGWKSSKPHYEAMINPEYTLTGIGISGDMIVQHFCIAA